MRFKVWDLRFGVWGVGFGVWGMGSGVWGLRNIGYRAHRRHGLDREPPPEVQLSRRYRAEAVNVDGSGVDSPDLARALHLAVRIVRGGGQPAM